MSASGKPAAGDELQNVETVRVAIRMRPLMDNEPADDSLKLRPTHNCIQVDNTSLGHSKILNFDSVFTPDHTQGDIYNTVAKSAVENFCQGFNATIFAYGQTGTGKTYTMLGPSLDELLSMQKTPEKRRMQKNALMSLNSITECLESNDERLGVIPRAVRHLFEFIRSERQKDPSASIELSCSYLEIYNEKMYDLLGDDDLNTLEIREQPDGTVYVPGLQEFVVQHSHDLFTLMAIGARRRIVDSTEMNEHSSRSHTIFQLNMVRKMNVNKGAGKDAAGSSMLIRSKLNLVDLAGSEKWKSYSAGPHSQIEKKEHTSINQSLSTLGNCVRALQDRQRTYVPFRDSKLTRLLQDSLGGNTKTLFIATLSPCSESIENSVSTLRFADRARRVELHVRQNTVEDEQAIIRRLQREVKKLKEDLKKAKQGGANEELEAQIRNLTEENLRLRENSHRMQLRLHEAKEESTKLRKLVESTSTSDSAGSPNSPKTPTTSASDGSGRLGQPHSPSGELSFLRMENRRLMRELKLSKELSAGNGKRQAELDAYHQWLQSITVRASASDSTATVETIDIINKVDLMEKSLAWQRSEVERMKRMFLRDAEVLHDQLEDKCLELQKSERRVQLTQKRLDAIRNILKNVGLFNKNGDIDIDRAKRAFSSMCTPQQSKGRDAGDELSIPAPDLPVQFSPNLNVGDTDSKHIEEFDGSVEPLVDECVKLIQNGMTEADSEMRTEWGVFFESFQKNLSQAILSEEFSAEELTGLVDEFCQTLFQAVEEKHQTYEADIEQSVREGHGQLLTSLVSQMAGFVRKYNDTRSNSTPGTVTTAAVKQLISEALTAPSQASQTQWSTIAQERMEVRDSVAGIARFLVQTRKSIHQAIADVSSEGQSVLEISTRLADLDRCIEAMPGNVGNEVRCLVYSLLKDNKEWAEYGESMRKRLVDVLQSKTGTERDGPTIALPQLRQNSEQESPAIAVPCASPSEGVYSSPQELPNDSVSSNATVHDISRGLQAGLNLGDDAEELYRRAEQELEVESTRPHLHEPEMGQSGVPRSALDYLNDDESDHASSAEEGIPDDIVIDASAIVQNSPIRRSYEGLVRETDILSQDEDSDRMTVLSEDAQPSDHSYGHVHMTWQGTSTTPPGHTSAMHVDVLSENLPARLRANSKSDRDAMSAFSAVNRYRQARKMSKLRNADMSDAPSYVESTQGKGDSESDVEEKRVSPSLVPVKLVNNPLYHSRQ